MSVGLTLQQIIDLDLKTNILETQIWFNYGWTDEFLTWEDNDKFKDVRFWFYWGSWLDIFKCRLLIQGCLSLKCGLLMWRFTMDWRENSLQDKTTLFCTKVDISLESWIFSIRFPGGGTTWVPPYKIKTTCNTDMTWYPFDDQKCDIKIGSWTYNGFQLDLQLVIYRVAGSMRP